MRCVNLQGTFKGTWNLFTQYIVDLQQDTAHNLEW